MELPCPKRSNSQEGSALCCDSVTYSDVFQGNNRFLGDMKSFVSRKVWEVGLKLAIQVRVVKRSMLRRLEEWKKEINKV